ncbi:hypothetical protein BB560_005297 [Smittium megazygosporum]|uniref:Uncharacterized protein n=1 Tax=Smittium megazygosporum TaxID=133381 RepID=A0A2T9Y1W8_9FUNG|nr:hypothetical protein BB560_006750 [Smittium megazygosporum]PVV00327.1 hypothetical protein BB560_005297 [Smittium megazygosporum]
MKHLQTEGANKINVLLFVATWVESCKQVEQMISVLAQSHPIADFFKLDADVFEGAVEAYGIEAVPSVLFVRGKTVLGQVEGVNPVQLNLVVDKLLGSKKPEDQLPVPNAAPVAVKVESKEQIIERIEKLLASQPVFAFIKGTPNNPRCGFSRRLVNILKSADISFGYFDILTDEGIRQELKEYSNWPTYPQLYIESELVGGIDIVEEMVANDELVDIVPESARLSSS